VNRPLPDEIRRDIEELRNFHREVLRQGKDLEQARQKLIKRPTPKVGD
jgi:hypothetical protein